MRQHILATTVVVLCASSIVPATEPEPCQAHITTVPDGAVILLDGEMRGTSPLTISALPPGKYLLNAAIPGYRDTRHTLSLQPGRRVAVNLELDQVLGLVLVHSTPANASVKIDSIDRGRTPVFISDLPPGTHLVSVSLTGYESKELPLDIRDRAPIKLDIALTSDTAALKVNSLPAGATVLLNGIARGTTPCTLDNVSPGETTIELRLEGYAPYREEITLHRGRTDEVNPALEQMPSELRVVSIPPKARIDIDNQFHGEAPVSLRDLDPGTYRVRAELAGYEPSARSVSLDPAERTVEEFRLVLNSGILNIATEPVGVRVLVDGREAGTTTTPDDETDRVSRQLTVELLSVGPHKVQLSKQGYYSRAFTIQISKDEATSIHQKMKRRFIPNYEVQTTETVERGVLVEIDPKGNVRLETHPGIFKTIAAKDITSCRPIKERKASTR